MAGVAAGYVEHRLRHRLSWPPDGPSRVIGPLAAAATGYTLAFGVTAVLDPLVQGRGADIMLNDVAATWLGIWLLWPIAPGAMAAVLALLLRLRRLRLAALAAAGIAPVTRLPSPAETDEDREVEANLAGNPPPRP